MYFVTYLGIYVGERLECIIVWSSGAVQCRLVSCYALSVLWFSLALQHVLCALFVLEVLDITMITLYCDLHCIDAHCVYYVSFWDQLKYIVMHRGFLPCIDAHCQCTRFLFLLAKEIQDQRRSWECQTKFWCIVPFFKTLSSPRFRIISEFSWKHCSVGQSCVLPLSYQGFSWWQRLTQWAKKKGVTDVSQAHNQSKPRQWAEIQVGGTRALSRIQYFFDTCPLLCKFVQDCVKDPEHNLEYLMLSCYVAQTGIWESTMTGTRVWMRWGLYLGPSHS